MTEVVPSLTASTPGPSPEKRNPERFAIECDGVCRDYQIHTSKAGSVKEAVIQNLLLSQGKKSTLRALHDISFQLPWGRSLAILGGNGSGKSTLLKLISGISEATSGTLYVNGRVAALLELGAGFHPDLTGMENIFLQGSILGMSRSQILERLGQVLDFCQLGKFIHTPMRCYSSGMHVRLGFALAVFSDADILLIDEVLAVGDSAFRSKCLQKITELRRRGKTILFVSHDIEHVTTVADDLLWIEDGETRALGPVADVLPRYLEALRGQRGSQTRKELRSGDQQHSLRFVAALPTLRTEHHGAAIETVRLLDGDERPRNAYDQGEPVTLEITFTAFQPLSGLDIMVGYAAGEGIRAGGQTSQLQGLVMRDIEGRHTVRARMDRLPFQPGRYQVTVCLANADRDHDYFDIDVNAATIQILGEKLTEGNAIVEPPGTFALCQPEAGENEGGADDFT